MSLYAVRIWFLEHDREVYDDLGPFDRYFADLVCIDFADAPFTFGITQVRVLRAMVVRWA